MDSTRRSLGSTKKSPFRKTTSSSTNAVVPPAPVQSARRSCACGGGCSACKQSASIQAKMTVSEPGDAFEREADRVADQVIGGRSTGVNRPEKPVSTIQRHGAANGTAVRDTPPIVNRVLGARGQPLEPGTKHFFEQSFGHDFTPVRVHDGPAAAASASALGASAYTAGANIVFGAGQYTPSTTSGRRLLAHELTHVVQQRAARNFDDTYPYRASSGNEPAQRSSTAVIQRQSGGTITSAQQLIDAHTSELGLDETTLGHQLAALVASSPWQISFATDVFDALDANQRDEVAYALVSGQPDDFIVSLAGFGLGRDFITRVRNEMEGGIQWPGESRQIERVDKIVRSIAPGTPASVIASDVIRRYETADKEKQFPGGDCFQVTRDRIEESTRAILGEELTDDLPERTDEDLLAPNVVFDRLWGSLVQRDCDTTGEPYRINATKTWLSIDERFRGKGAAGAMAWAGKGVLVEGNGIWRGDLAPGAIVQVWENGADFERVKAGDCSEGIGHSFIFHSYVRKDDDPKGAIVGMRIMDQGYQGEDILTPAHWGFWVAANINFGPQEPF